MSKTSYICNCDVIHEDIVNDVKSKMQPKDDYIQLDVYKRQTLGCIMFYFCRKIFRAVRKKKGRER